MNRFDFHNCHVPAPTKCIKNEINLSYKVQKQNEFIQCIIILFPCMENTSVPKLRETLIMIHMHG